MNRMALKLSGRVDLSASVQARQFLQMAFMRVRKVLRLATTSNEAGDTVSDIVSLSSVAVIDSQIASASGPSETAGAGEQRGSQPQNQTGCLTRELTGRSKTRNGDGRLSGPLIRRPVRRVPQKPGSGDG